MAPVPNIFFNIKIFDGFYHRAKSFLIALLRQRHWITFIVFEAMKILTEKDVAHNIILVSGDGDYRKLVDYLIEKKRFKKILFPNRKFASSSKNIMSLKPLLLLIIWNATETIMPIMIDISAA